MTKILEFLGVFAFISFKNSKIPYRDPRVKPEDDIVGNSRIPKPCVIPQLDWGISSQRILKFPASLRGSKATEARNSKFILRNSRIPCHPRA